MEDMSYAVEAVCRRNGRMLARSCSTLAADAPWAAPGMPAFFCPNRVSLTLGIRVWFGLARLKQWLHSRGVSNAQALPWAKPWLQLCDVDS